MKQYIQLTKICHKYRSKGASMIEFALVLPILLTLCFGTLELVRALQANNILVSISREGANLITRSSQDPQTIMAALANTAAPLDMLNQGTVMITELVGNSDGEIEITNQTRYNQTSYIASSEIWPGCGGWSNSSCNGGLPAILSASAIDNIFWQAAGATPLSDGERAFAVETFYRLDPITSIPFNESLNLYSVSLF